MTDPTDPTDSIEPRDPIEPPADAAAPAAALPGALPPWFTRGLVAVGGLVVALYAARWVLVELRVLVMMLAVALFLSLAMEPLVDRLAQRGWRRGSATGVVMLGLLVVMASLIGATASVVVTEAKDLIDNAPKYARDLERFVNDDLGIDWDADSLVRDLRSGDAVDVDQGAITRTALDVGLGVGGALLQIATVLVFAFYMTADGPRMRRTICSRLPRRHQEVVLSTWEVAIDKTGGYLYSRGIQAVISAVVTMAFLLVLDVPFAIALGVWVGIISQFIPTIGTYIAMVLPVLVAFKESPSTALIVLGFLVAYQQFENYVLGPRITRQTMSVHPALAIGTVFAGGLLLGAVGAILALPATAVIQAVISRHTIEQEVVASRLTTEPGRRRRSVGLRSRRSPAADDGGDAGEAGDDVPAHDA
ncbi:MAG: AI-2E family transporter [Actinobacteria bacterium]|nr:AI-2E family transporter [Actinomycetota bacterium]